MTPIVEITSLEFDSQLFSLNVKSLDLPEEISLTGIVDVILKTDFDLLYVFSVKRLETEILQNSPLIVLSYCDEKVVFSGPVQNLVGASCAVKITSNHFKQADVPDLENLAYQSGEFSRFFMDKRIPRKAFKALYSTWLRKSLSGEYADDYFIAYDGRPVGLLTSSIKENVARVGLLAVDVHYRGRGIGQGLLSRFAIDMKEKGIEKVFIPTQRINANACRFYQALGLSENENIFIYHCWKKNG
ncbi:MAG: GNAT family N-acetyltransferase [Gammaproteobacteria bacterium]|nr:GNAT family N-acetyltransferase [Gammaproteobacteria bacterium]